MIRIVRASKLNKKQIVEMNKLFVYSFCDYFNSFCVDKEKMTKAFKKSLDKECFYAVLLAEEVIGIGAISDGSCSLKLNKKRFCSAIGKKVGRVLFDYLNNIWVERDYSFEIDKECALIEFVCVKEMYRNKKVGFTLVNHIMHDNKYVRYLAKVGNNNYSCRTMLENIGFEEFDQEQASIKEKEDMGVDNYMYVICDKK